MGSVPKEAEEMASEFTRRYSTHPFTCYQGERMLAQCKEKRVEIDGYTFGIDSSWLSAYVICEPKCRHYDRGDIMSTAGHKGLCKNFTGYGTWGCTYSGVREWGNRGGWWSMCRGGWDR